MAYEAEVDDRGRLSLGRAGVRPGRRYRIEQGPGGEIRLTPMVSVPEREMGLLRDTALQQRLHDGMGQAARGETHDLGDFSQYAD